MNPGEPSYVEAAEQSADQKIMALTHADHSIALAYFASEILRTCDHIQLGFLWFYITGIQLLRNSLVIGSSQKIIIPLMPLVRKMR